MDRKRKLENWIGEEPKKLKVSSSQVIFEYKWKVFRMYVDSCSLSECAAFSANDIVAFVIEVKDPKITDRALNNIWNLVSTCTYSAEVYQELLHSQYQLIKEFPQMLKDDGTSTPRKLHWLTMYLEFFFEIEYAKNPLTLKLLKAIIKLFRLYSPKINDDNDKITPIEELQYLPHIASRLELKYQIFYLSLSSLKRYCQHMRRYTVLNEENEVTYYNNLEERLDFLRFLSVEGNIYFAAWMIKMLFKTLVMKSKYEEEINLFVTLIKSLLTKDAFGDSFIDKDYYMVVFSFVFLDYDFPIGNEYYRELFQWFFIEVNLQEEVIRRTKDNKLVITSISMIGLHKMMDIIVYGHRQSYKVVDFLVMNLLRHSSPAIHEGFVDMCLDKMQLFHMALKECESLNLINERYGIWSIVNMLNLRYVIKTHEQAKELLLYNTLVQSNYANDCSAMLSNWLESKGRNLKTCDFNEQKHSLEWQRDGDKIVRKVLSFKDGNVTLCHICLENVTNLVLVLNCHHVICTKLECRKSVRGSKCPVCRSYIYQRVKVTKYNDVTYEKVKRNQSIHLFEPFDFESSSGESSDESDDE